MMYSSKKQFTLAHSLFESQKLLIKANHQVAPFNLANDEQSSHSSLAGHNEKMKGLIVTPSLIVGIQSHYFNCQISWKTGYLLLLIPTGYYCLY